MGTTDPKGSSDSSNPAVAVTARARQNSGAVPGPQDSLSAMALDVQILGPLSEGPLSRTWRAKAADERLVALVVLRDELTDAERERFAGAFKRARSLAELPAGVLRVLEVASSRDAFLTELWAIGTANELRTLAWPARRRLDFVRRAAVALDALHRAGIVHGCLSEEAILLSDAFDPIVADAGTMSIPSLIEQHRDAASSVSFAAPEVLEGPSPTSVATSFRWAAFSSTCSGGTQCQRLPRCSASVSRRHPTAGTGRQPSSRPSSSRLPTRFPPRTSRSQ